jgi:hypothetical protein
MRSCDDVEQLLSPEARQRLPFARQVLIYLDPFSLFKNTSVGPGPARERALSYNRAMRWMLLPYMRRWTTIALALFLGISPAEALAAQTSLAVLPAALAVGACIAVPVTFVIAVCYVFLGKS